jgi:hypothetical protein
MSTRPICDTCEQQRRQRPRRALQLPIATIDQLRVEARRRGTNAADLAETILEVVVADDLYSAVIDR